VRTLVQREWDQLLIVAAGFLPMTGGDLKLAMSKAIAAHADLIEAIRRGEIDAELPRGSVRLFVPAEGGLALAYTSNKRTPGGATYDDLGPPDVSIDVHEDHTSFEVDPTGRGS
jgi:hypothetical protein